jgi:CelD/BcsL family acetyltransferase involved in cellulose biosynthesis
MLIGSVEISDFLDLLVRPENLETFIEALFNHLDNPEAPDWKVLDWYNLLDSSPTLLAIEKLAAQKGWEFTQEQLKPAPYIKLPDNWETYLAGIQKKQRHEIRRKMRRAAGHFLPVRWYIVEDEFTLDAEISAFLDLMAYDQEKEAFLTEAMKTQMRAAIQAAYRAGWLQLAFLEVGEEKAAAYLNFDYDNQIWVYNSGINYEFNKLSPGWVLLGHLIQWAIENGRESLDFMRGDEAYKYRFGGVNRYVIRAKVERV